MRPSAARRQHQYLSVTRFLSATVGLGITVCAVAGNVWALSTPPAEPARHTSITADRDATFALVRQLLSQGRPAEAETALLRLTKTPGELWRIGPPESDVDASYSAGHLLVISMLVRGQIARADRYVAEARRGDAPTRGYVDYEGQLAKAQVRQAQGRLVEAAATYNCLAYGFPTTGFGTFSRTYFLLEAEIDIGRAEVLLAQGDRRAARKILQMWTDKAIGELEPRLNLALNEARKTHKD